MYFARGSREYDIILFTVYGVFTINNYYCNDVILVIRVYIMIVLPGEFYDNKWKKIGNELSV